MAAFDVVKRAVTKGENRKAVSEARLIIESGVEKKTAAAAGLSYSISKCT